MLNAEPKWEGLHVAFAHIAALMDGEFIDKGLGQKGVLVAEQKWTIFLDATPIQAGEQRSPDPFAQDAQLGQRLRLRAPIENHSRLQFEIQYQEYADKLGLAFEEPTAAASIPRLGAQYALRGNAQAVLSSIFNQGRLPQLILKSDIYRLGILENAGAKRQNEAGAQSFLTLQTHQPLIDEHTIQNLFEIMNTLLNRLHALNMIRKKDLHSPLNWAA